MTRPTYAELGDACATAHAMELIGNRWTYPILRELMLGPKRFNALLVSVRGITPAVLTARLRELTETGLVEAVIGSAPTLHAYNLTPWARDLAPILRELGRWAQSSPNRSPLGGLTPDAVVQAMVTMAEGLSPTRGVHAQLQLFDARADVPTDAAYCVRWDADGFRATRSDCPDAVTTIRCDSSIWGRIIFTKVALAEGEFTITGDQTAARNLISDFRRSNPRRPSSPPTGST
jgi:DNA-binding HxlR family transcriptional regulator